jgi:ATP-dependent RNA helicase RhlE
MNSQKQESTTGFYGLGIAPTLLDTLTRLKFKVPTPIQEQAIPIAIEGKDMVGIAQTGTGKTIAFGIPLIQRLARVNGNGLVVLPTRELALQVDEVFQKIGRGIGLRTAVLIGGTAMGPQMSALQRKPHVIIATPGRLLDHMNQKHLKLDATRIVVLDEADRMLDMGFLPQIQKILSALPKERQMMLFSATMPHDIMKIASTYMKLPIRVEIAPAGTAAENVTQELFLVSKEKKIGLLAKILEQYMGPTLIFSRTKHGAKKILWAVKDMNIAGAEIHSNRSLSQRREALEGFKSGKYRVLVATDIASRGIDVVGIELVLNFDLPTTSDDYIHRIGRTARAGRGGHAITFAMPDQQKEVRDIERLLKKTLPIAQHPDFPQLDFSQSYVLPRKRGGARGYAGASFGGRRGGIRHFGSKRR